MLLCSVNNLFQDAPKIPSIYATPRARSTRRPILVRTLKAKRRFVVLGLGASSICGFPVGQSGEINGVDNSPPRPAAPALPPQRGNPTVYLANNNRDTNGSDHWRVGQMRTNLRLSTVVETSCSEDHKLAEEMNA
ncbi:hypothetical protein ACLOJK_014026 [Asimina triloba]